MSRCAVVLLVVVVLSVCGAVSLSQGPPTDQPGPAAAEFQKALAELKGVLADLAAVQADYRTAKEEDRGQLRTQWNALVEKGETMRPRLLKAAEDAYREAPNAERQVAELLVAVVERAFKSEDYEEAFRLGKILAANHCEDRRVANMAGIAAFVTNDFDAAQKYLAEAEQDKTLSPTGQGYLQDIAKARPAWAKEKQLRDAEAKADNLPRVLLKTTKGEIELELFENEAPNTVANFIALVEKKFYDGLMFHRVLQGFMAQAGCPKGDGSGGPGYTIPCECRQPNHRLHFRGSLSMAKRPRPDTGGSQFFLTFVPTSFLDGEHTVFGRVVKGMEVLARLQRRDPEKPNQPPPDKILQAEVLRKQQHPYVPKTLPEK